MKRSSRFTIPLRHRIASDPLHVQSGESITRSRRAQLCGNRYDQRNVRDDEEEGGREVHLVYRRLMRSLGEKRRSRKWEMEGRNYEQREI